MRHKGRKGPRKEKNGGKSKRKRESKEGTSFGRSVRYGHIIGTVTEGEKGKSKSKTVQKSK